jgi:class 3 adenylate cyclase/tetratricopeptide (TPR) repeat protein
MANSLGGHPDRTFRASGAAWYGATLPEVSSEAPITAGRRAVTALFADVAGSTRLGAELDPEDVVEIVGGTVRRFCEIVERYGGTVKDVAGDGILALFGAPNAHEDDPERAVLAGLEIQQVAAQHARTITRDAGIDPLGVRVGIETGIVVIAPVGGGSRLEMGATGDAVNTAARLQAEAEIGTVLVGPETRRQLGDSMRWGPPQPFELKGKRAVVEGAIALGSRGRATDLDVPLVGRGDELRTITGVIDDLTRGTGRTLILVGEAGIGKSRLLAEARRHARDANVAWLDGQCSAMEEGTPFAAFRGLLRSSLSLVDVGGEPGSILRRLMEGEPISQEVDRTPEALRFGTLEAIATFAAEASRQGPAVLCLEDLQWSDPSTLDAVRRLRDRARVDPVAVVATARIVTGHASRTLITELEADPSAIVLALGRLAPDDERRLLQELSGHALARGTEESILEASDGIPLYLREFVRSFEAASGDPTAERAVPPTLDRLILARIDRLPAAARETATALSVLGRDVDLAIARSSVLGDNSDASLGELVRQGLIDIEGTRCSFSHGLVQEVAYSTLLRDRRKDLHRRAAETLEASSKDRPHPPAALAYHWERAGERLHAIGYHVAAADAAEAVSALIEALGHVDAAVRLAEGVEAVVDQPALVLRRAMLHDHLGNAAAAREDAERVLTAARSRRDRHLELRALEELGSILAGAVDYRAATPLFDEALHLAEVSGDRTELVRCHARLSIAWTNRLRFDRGLEHAERARAIATDGQGSALEGTALDALKQVELQIGDLASAEGHVHQVLDFAERRGDLWSAQVCELELGLIATLRGRWDEARSHLERGSELNREVRDDGNMPVFPATRGWLARVQGEYGTSLRLATLAWDAAREHGHAEWTAWSAISLGSLFLDLGAHEEASPILEEGAFAAERSGSDLHGVRCWAKLGQSRSGCGDAAGARDALERVDDVLRRTVLPPDRTNVFAWDAYVAAALIRGALGDGAWPAPQLETLVGHWGRDGVLEAVADGHLALARLAAHARDHPRAGLAAQAALVEAEAAGLPGSAWRAHALLSAFPGEDPGHVLAARSIVEGLTSSLSDHRLAGVLNETLERELGGSP